MKLYFFPFASKKISFASSPTSSKVSKQSDTNPGQKICIFFIPSSGSSFNLSDKYGFNHSDVPNRDWKTTS